MVSCGFVALWCLTWTSTNPFHALSFPNRYIAWQIDEKPFCSCEVSFVVVAFLHCCTISSTHPFSLSLSSSDEMMLQAAKILCSCSKRDSWSGWWGGVISAVGVDDVGSGALPGSLGEEHGQEVGIWWMGNQNSPSCSKIRNFLVKFMSILSFYTVKLGIIAHRVRFW